MDNHKEYINSFLRKAHDAPGYRYLHFDQDRILVDVMGGLASIRSQTPVTDRTSFNAFSTTKTFTSLAVLMLSQSGRINLDDPVKKYLPDYSIPTKVKVTHLLSHQSGISNPIPLNWIHLKEEHSSFNNLDFTESILQTKAKFKGNPGSKFSYSNLNYLLLGRVVELITNEPFESYVSNTILNKLNGPDYSMDFKYPEHDHAIGHHRNNLFQRFLLKLLIDKKGLFHVENQNWLSLNPFYLNGSAYGGIFSHPKAMVKYCKSLMPGNETFITDSVKELIYTEHSTEKGRPTGMSLGWFTGKLAEEKYICHAGGGAGYYAEIRIYPDIGKGSLIMLNSSGMRDKRLLSKIDTKIFDYAT